MSDPRTPDDLQRHLTERRIAGEIVTVTDPTPTVAAAAEALGVTVDQIVKTVLFMVNDAPYAVFANGVRRVDRRKIAQFVGISPKRVKLADGETVIARIGYAPGTVPPVDHQTPVTPLIDRAVLAQSVIYAGGGGLHAMLKMTVAELMRVTGAQSGDFLEDAPEGST